MTFGSECRGELNGWRGEGCDDGLVGQIGHPFAEPIDSVLGDVEVISISKIGETRDCPTCGCPAAYTVVRTTSQETDHAE